MSRQIVEFLRNAPAAYHPGWGAPEYSSWQDEQLSWKQSCYLGDWSFLWDIEVEGRDALRLFSETGVNSVAKFDIGQAKHLVQCDSAGKVITDGVLMRLSEHRFRTQSSPAFYTAWVIEKGGYDVTWRELQTFQFQVSGPNALAVCEAATGESLRDIKFMHFRQVTIAGKKVYALRQGMAGEIGFEFHGDAADASTVRSAILAVGEPFGIRRLGRRTAMINHLEAAFPTGVWHYVNAMFSPELAGYAEFIGRRFDTKGLAPCLRGSYEADDISEYTLSPFELGWGKCVKFDHEFIGRAALEAEVAHPKRARVTLEWNSEDVIDIYASLFSEGQPHDYIDMPHPQRWIAWADAVLQDGRTIGISASPGYSYYFRRVLTLAFIDSKSSTPGHEVEVLWGSPGSAQKRVRAVVAPAPYKTDRRRQELTSQR